MDVEIILITLVYLSILVELTILHVPSVASTFQLFYYSDTTQDGTLMKRVKNWPVWVKSLALFVPTAISVGLYILPLLFVFYPESKVWFKVISTGKSLQYVGWSVIFAGRFLALFSVVQIRKANSQTNSEFSLKTGGWFSFSRNPILIGMYITYIGFIILFPNWVMAIGFIIYFANMHFRILLEEDFLQQKFGNQFTAYLKQTRRYI
jgi:protein-S-isoprenylcysteine O-methyltransferase Ste14